MNAPSLLIATDEAGYGPKLGPLVVAATAWRLPDGFNLRDQRFTERSTTMSSLFAPLAKPFHLDPTWPAIHVGDSKQLFQAGNSRGLIALEAVVQAAVRWIGGPPVDSLAKLLDAFCPRDGDALRQQPWFSESLLAGLFPSDASIRELASHRWEPLQKSWEQTGLALVDLNARVIDAAAFNKRCSEGFNKAEILSEATMGLVTELLDRHRAEEVHVYCDRHGGRRYYAGLVQHTRPESRLQIEHESAEISCYRQHDSNGVVNWQFTVKGDAFPPVSFSSMVAKYLRERMMGCFNAYWQTHHTTSFKPTAGYPNDAKRFLADIELTRLRLRIEHATLCRQR